MPTDQETMRVKDVANAAGVIADAVRNARARDLRTVSTPYGRADVILDGSAADVTFPDRGVTVHVRGIPGSGKNER